MHAELTWTLKQVMALTAPEPFEELQTANRELLRTLLELAACRTKTAERSAPANREPDAA
jgi:hypothetical protein